MVRKIIVTNGNSSGAHYSINKTVSAVTKGAMIDPDFLGTENGNPITVRSSSPSNMRRRRSNVGVPRWFTMVNVDVMYNNMGDILQCYTPIPRDMNGDTTAVDGFERVENQLVLQLDDHVCWEDDPEGFVLNDGVAESAWFGVSNVVVGGIHDGVDSATFSAEGSLPETYRTVS